MIGYKVVDATNPRHMHSASMRMEWLACCTYKVGETTKRPEPHGPLACFDSLECAREFYEEMGAGRYFYQYKIFKCEYEPSADTYLWKQYVGNIEENDCAGIPGTVFADSITLLEEIHVEHS